MRITNQQEIIRRALERLGGHLGAEEVFKRVRRSLPRISLATVYRNLQRLVELGHIQTVHIRGKAYFEPSVGPHSHFLCFKCGKIKNIEIQQTTLEATLKRKGYTPESIEIITMGICKECTGARPG